MALMRMAITMPMLHMDAPAPARAPIAQVRTMCEATTDICMGMDTLSAPTCPVVPTCVRTLPAA
eukprot:3249839-Amphidinium_carterae.1